MRFNPSVSFDLAGLVQRAWAPLGRVGGTVFGGMQRFAVVRWRVARICWRDLGRAWSKSSERDEAATGYLGGWWNQSPESQRTTVRRRAGV
jgi:hypothetical protein